MRATIGIASAGRPETLGETADYLLSILDSTDRIAICVPSQEDAADLNSRSGIDIIVGPRGLTRQRNHIMADAIAARSELVVFLDDDFTPAPDYVQRMKTVFSRDRTVVIATGRVVVDGILGAPVSFSESLDIIAGSQRGPAKTWPVYNSYGCNMAIRLQTVHDHALAFDEQLPLYGWLEDVDFARAIAPYGHCLKVADAIGVHRGVRSGRQPGMRLGYSQIANPIHLLRKGTMSPSRALGQMTRNILANAWGSLRGSSEVDRIGRLKGNASAFADLLRGRISPVRILKLDNHTHTVSATSMSSKQG